MGFRRAVMSDNGRPERRIWKPDVRKDVDDELSFHLEMRQRDLAERGAAPARRARRGAAPIRQPERGRGGVPRHR